MKRFIFLDVDGVLNSHSLDPLSQCGEIHGDKVRRLNRLLFRTGAKLVLSSAWRYLMHREEMNLAGMDWLLRSHGLHAGRLVGFTRPDTMSRVGHHGWAGAWPMTNERGMQVWDWITREGWDLYKDGGRHVVIDDLDLGISEQDHPFVQTDGRVGLTEADIDRAEAILKGGAGWSGDA